MQCLPCVRVCTSHFEACDKVLVVLHCRRRPFCPPAARVAASLSFPASPAAAAAAEASKEPPGSVELPVPSPGPAAAAPREKPGRVKVASPVTECT